MTTMEMRVSTDPLLQQLLSLDWPELALDAPSPQRGQVWRAAWMDDSDPVACMVIVMSAPVQRWVDVVPVTDDEIGDDQTVRIITNNGLALSAWTGLRRQIYKFTLEHRLGDLASETISKVELVMKGEIAGEWSTIASDFDDRALARADLSDRLEVLATADWLPSISGPTVQERADAAGIPASEIARALGIAPGDARRLRDGDRLPTESELEILKGLLGNDLATNFRPDEDLLADLDEPEFRHDLQELAQRRHHGDERRVRIYVATTVSAAAHRHRDAGSRDWKTAIRDVLAQD